MTLENDTPNDGTDTATLKAAEKAKRSRWTFNEETGCADVFDPVSSETKSYSLSALPNVSAKRLAFIGACTVIGRSGDPDAAYAGLMSGNPPARKAAKVKIDNWRLAIAHTMVDLTKKTAEPMTIDAAKAKTLALTAAEVKPRKLDTSVVKHFVRLSGATGNGVQSLLTPPDAA